MTDEPPIYTAAYRPVRRGQADAVDVWAWPLAVGSLLPAVPLKGFGCVRLDLEATYTEACERARII